jgi:hypothetical protein
MHRAVLLVSDWIASAHDRWRTEAARRTPLSARIDELQERVRRLTQENELLRGRLLRVSLRRRPRYRRWDRLLILIHQARYGLSLRATARAFVVAAQTIVKSALRLVTSRSTCVVRQYGSISTSTYVGVVDEITILPSSFVR